MTKPTIKDWKITLDLSTLKDFNDIQEVAKQIMWPIVNSMLNVEMDHHLGYSKHSKEWYWSWNSRNGKYKKKIHTSHWDMEIDIPRDREWSFEPELVPKYTSNVWDLDARILNMMKHWMTSWEICDHLKDIYWASANKDMITAVSDKIIPEIKAWSNRPLESFYTVVYLDAIHFKIREWDKYENKAAYVVLWIGWEWRKDVLWIYVWENEKASFWQKVCTELRNRWVSDILFACVDWLSGFSQAIQSNFPESIVQRCVVHQIRSSTRYVWYKDRKEFIGDLKKIYKADTLELAEEALLWLEEKRWKKYPTSVSWWVWNWAELSAYFAYSKEIRRLIYTTNPIESFNRQLRQVTKKITVFPNVISLKKRLYLWSQKAVEKRTMPVQNRWLILWELVMHFWVRVEKWIK